MIILLITLTLIIVFLIIATMICLNRIVQLMDKIDELGTQIDESLSILNDSYQKISQVVELPVASDDPFVKEVIADIRHVRDAILLIANKIVSFDQEDDEQEPNNV